MMTSQNWISGSSCPIYFLSLPICCCSSSCPWYASLRPRPPPPASYIASHPHSADSSTPCFTYFLSFSVSLSYSVPSTIFSATCLIHHLFMLRLLLSLNPSHLMFFLFCPCIHFLSSVPCLICCIFYSFFTCIFFSPSFRLSHILFLTF